MKSLFTRVLALLCFSSLATADETSFDADVLIYGGTPAGIAAAVSAAKDGRSVYLIEPTEMIGGLVTSGLSNADFRSLESLTGFFLDFANRVQGDYESKYGPNSPQAVAAFHGTHGEPSVNLMVLKRMLADYPSITVHKELQLTVIDATPYRTGRQRIRSATFQTSNQTLQTFSAKVFIDATYEGDLMALAGEPYHVGRESRSQYDEPLAGDQNGHADGQVQGYNLRLIMTKVAANRRAPVAPENYDRKNFADVVDALKRSGIKHVFAADRNGIFRAHEPLLPNGKADVNDTPHAAVRLSMPDINDAYPDGDTQTRQQIIDQHYVYNLGLLYFLQADSAVPPELQADALQWGFCRDEFPATNGIPPKLYIREARRLIGQHVFTGKDTKQAVNDARSVLHVDSIAIGDYVHNCHGTGRAGTRYNGTHSGEFYKNVPPYQIPYGVIVPQRSENLLVPVACSASHFGFGALRLEPIWCSLGQAAGWAAVLSLKQNTPVQTVNVADLQLLLHQDHSATIYVSDVPPKSALFASVQRLGTLGGLHGLAPSQQPKPTSIGGQYTSAFPGHAVDLDQPLDPALKKRWLEKLNLKTAPQAITTRRDMLEYANSIQTDK